MSHEKFVGSRIDENQNLRSENISKLNPDDQDYWYYCSHSYVDDSNIHDDKNKNKDIKHKYHKDKRHTKTMDALICNSCDMLNEYFDPKKYPNHQIPYNLFQDCKGIIFLRIWKAGIILGGLGGTGIVMSHWNGQWSNPCAISIGGLQLGLEIGVERVDDILLLRDDIALKLFEEKGGFKLGADASICLGPYGRDANTGIAMSGGQSKSIYAYSFAKGAYIGLSLDGGVLSVNNKANEEFYGQKVGVRDIFYGNLIMPQSNDLNRLKQLLNNYVSSNQNFGTQQTTTTTTFNQNVPQQNVNTLNNPVV